MTTVTGRPVEPTSEQLAALARSSLATIIELQDASGAYPASPTFSAYRGYSWFRDGAFIADGVSSYGGVASATAFFDWCSRILEAREGQIGAIVAAAAAGEPVPDSGMLAARFTLEGLEGGDEWWDFQLDGYGTWLWAVAQHAERHNLDLSPWQRAIELSVDYLLSSWHRPCFDWWEENADRVHGSTLGCIVAGLSAVLPVLGGDRESAARAAVTDITALLRAEGLHNGHLAKWLGSSEVDASLVAVVAPLGVFAASDPIGLATIEAVDARLAMDGGVHRYLADTFFGGGQWPLLSCFLGLAHAEAGNRDRALELLRFAASTAGPDGSMPEQVGGHLLDPGMTEEWVARWGPIAQPLLWSHAMYIRLAVALDVVTPTTEVAA